MWYSLNTLQDKRDETSGFYKAMNLGDSQPRDKPPIIQGPSPTAAAPGLPDSVFEFCRAPQQFLLDLARTRGPVVPFRVNSERFVTLADPDCIHQVLTGPFDDFEKGELYDLIAAAFGDSIFTVDPPQWQELHQAIAPLFSRARPQSMRSCVGSIANRHMQGWEPLAETGQPVEILARLKRLAFDIIAEGLLGIRHQDTLDRMFAVLHRGERTEAVRLMYLGKRMAAVRTRFRSSPLSEQIEAICGGIARDRIATRTAGAVEPPDNLVDDLIASPAFQGMPSGSRPKFVRDLISSILSAAYVTTADGLFWSLYLLARNPAAQQRAYEETRARSAPSWTPAVISESLRLYPPVWFLGRIARRRLRIGGVEIAENTRIMCSPWVLHRMPSLWPDPDEFRPERFLPGNTVPPRSYLPFGSGRRACTGRALALMELSTLVPEILSRFELRPTDGEPPGLAATFSMQPSRPVYLRLLRR